MWDRKGEDLHIWEYIFEKHFAFWTQWWVVRKQWDLFKWDRVWNHKNITISYCHKIYNVAKLMYEFISFKKCCKINLIVVNSDIWNWSFFICITVNIYYRSVCDVKSSLWCTFSGRYFQTPSLMTVSILFHYITNLNCCPLMFAHDLCLFNALHKKRTWCYGKTFSSSPCHQYDQSGEYFAYQMWTKNLRI